MPMDEVVTIVGAVGNHEEQNGKVVSAVSAALIIADKSDAHRTRVRRASYNPDDIHDRVNSPSRRTPWRSTPCAASSASPSPWTRAPRSWTSWRSI